MKKELWFGVLIGLVAATTMALLTGQNKPAYAQTPIPTTDGSSVVVNVDAASGGQFIVVVDTSRRVMGSYHVNAETGNIALKSVRNFHWDFQMEEFNGAEPKPQDVRAIVEKR